MTWTWDIANTNAAGRSLFIRSPHHLGELCRIAASAGWVCADRGEDLPVGGAALAVIDARGDADGAVEAVAALADRVGGLLVLTSTAEDMLDRALGAGATHFLTVPASEAEFLHALRFAALPNRIGHGRRRDDPQGVWPCPRLETVRNWAQSHMGKGRGVVAVHAALARFDIVNAAFGRSRGDAILAEARDRLRRVARDLFGAEGLVSRASGAEFVLVGDRGRAGADRTAAAVACALAAPFARVSLGSRTGSAESGANDDAAAVLHRADAAMRRAREGGWVIRSSREENVALADELAVDLHHGLGRGEITILFQPQAEVATGRIVGVEALARWQHPRLGSLGADALFSAAERAGLGVPLSDYIQKLTLERAAAWPRSLGHLRVSLNLTAADIGRPGFAELFLDRVGRSGFPVDRLTAELTESGLIADLDATAGLLATLRTAGCRTAIDDFGTGYSSLAYLQSLPVDYLKLDRVLAQQSGDRTVVAGVLAIARALGLGTIAEGVETQEQRRRLAAEGCDLYQGYLCAGALDEAALVRLVEKGDAG